MKVEMKETEYYKSGEHTVNILAARNKAIQSSIQNKQNRINLYNLNSKICEAMNCTISLSYDKRKNRYCSKSCAATTNNTGRPVLKSSNIKRSNSLKGRKRPNTGFAMTQTMSKITFRRCIICESPFYIRFWPKEGRITCGRKCHTIASVGLRPYPNGARKITWYFNKYQNKNVLLESSWEVIIAQLLDEKDLVWIRPDPIDWIDYHNKSHLYYPDFYLPKYNLFLDPKNSWGISKSLDKMNIVSKLINLEYGSLDKIKDIINNLQ